MKVFIGCLGTETNTFSPLPTGWQTFEETMLFRGDATQRTEASFSGPLHVWRRMAEERNHQVVEGLAAFAQPAGITVRNVYESLRQELLDGIAGAMPLDMVLINMHGAMVGDGYDDCEGDILARVREIVGPDVVIGAELDLHCSITDAMTSNADVLVTFKEYPHVDMNERAREVFDICLAKSQGDADPVIALYDCRMINMWRTPVEPTAGLVRRMQEQEGRDGILSVSFAHGFPWGDVADASAKVMVIADGDGARAAQVARQFGAEIWQMRDEAASTGVSIDEALDLALAAPAGPVVLADVSDNAGGGAPSDSTFLLHAMLERNIENAVSGIYWDPVAVRFCREAGEGASFDLRIGGKCGVASGDPVDLRITVRGIIEDAWQYFGNGKQRMGTAVWVEGNGIDLILNTVRTQTFHPRAFEQFGIDLAAKQIIALKSTQHFYAGFAPVAKEVIKRSSTWRHRAPYRPISPTSRSKSSPTPTGRGSKIPSTRVFNIHRIARS
jgi:microcystin degradation protein MlrC